MGGAGSVVAKTQDELGLTKRLNWGDSGRRKKKKKEGHKKMNNCESSHSSRPRPIIAADSVKYKGKEEKQTPRNISV